MDKDARIRELEAQIAMLISDPRAKFYSALCKGVEYITLEVENKTLDFDEDAFAKAVLVLSEKSEKMFAGLTKGMETFSPQKEEGSKKAKKAIASNQDQLSV